MKQHKINGEFVLQTADGQEYKLDAIDIKEIELHSDHESIGLYAKNIISIPQISNCLEKLSMLNGTTPIPVKKSDICFDCTITQYGQIVVRIYNAMCIFAEDEYAEIQCESIYYDLNHLTAAKMSNIHKKNTETYFETMPDYGECYD